MALSDAMGLELRPQVIDYFTVRECAGVGRLDAPSSHSSLHNAERRTEHGVVEGDPP